MASTGNEQSLSFQVLGVRQKENEFYIASIPARDLVSIAYADVRRLAEEKRDVERYLGVQRPVNPDRIKQIRKYLESPDASFPTGIILAVDERCVALKDGTMTLKPYQAEQDVDELSIPFERIAKVLDGQHRLAGFLDDNKNWSFDFGDGEAFQLNACIFVGADMATQAEIFATVNLAQTKVNRSLAYDLQDFAESRNPYKTCHDVAVAMDRLENSPLRERIKRLGVRTPDRQGETITQAAFVESLVRLISKDPMRDRNTLLDGKSLPYPTVEELQKTPFRGFFLDNDDLSIIEIVFNYFSAVRDKWPNSWKEVSRRGNFIPRSNAFKALMRYLGDVYVEIAGPDFKRVPTKAEFSPYFIGIELTDEVLNTKTFVPGSSGQSLFYKLLTGKINLNDILEK